VGVATEEKNSAECLRITPPQKNVLCPLSNF
jgi:hypothetical protein